MEQSFITRTAAGIAVAILAAIALSCHPGSGLVQETLPAESAVVDITGAKTARIRSIYCDITVEPIDASDWERLAGVSAYRRAGPGPLSRRTPPLAAFLVIVKNTVNAPIRLEKAQILHDGATMAALTADRAGDRLRSPAYSWIDFRKLLSPRRLIAEPEPLRKLDFDRDTIDTRLDFIPPQDHVLTIIAFDWIPVEIRKYRVDFTVSAMGGMRNLAVEFTRNEYRGWKKTGKDPIYDYDE
ncbi:MAG TPA: hypothetical protein PLM53_18915 [Spirochaetota bacterium]|nr:hypothetical protein [Spirochaetota bacterium]HPC42820.1 hypothetical protein [Spirochaetota bacterium]HPL18001.1 hypothetical protein [Spirochaetota bacterium]HQF10291.1 hypothetical protein [Spirochaetota bacterium]HQH99169.1 hypothetical protein [Spirochaetota bacterium]